MQVSIQHRSKSFQINAPVGTVLNPMSRVPGIPRDPVRGARIYALREELRLSRPELGERLGVSKWSIAKWEKGERLQRSNLRALAAELKTTEAYLLGMVEDSVTDSPEARFEELETQVGRLRGEVSDLAKRLQSVAASVEQLALRTPLPGEAGRQRPGKGEPRRQT